METMMTKKTETSEAWTATPSELQAALSKLCSELAGRDSRWYDDGHFWALLEDGTVWVQSDYIKVWVSPVFINKTPLLRSGPDASLSDDLLRAHEIEDLDYELVIGIDARLEGY